MRNDPHYMPQSQAIEDNDATESMMLKLEDFSNSIPSQLAVLSPRFAEAFKKIPRAHVSPKPYKNQDVFESEMQYRLNQIYWDDFHLYGQIDPMPAAE